MPATERPPLGRRPRPPRHPLSPLVVTAAVVAIAMIALGVVRVNDGHRSRDAPATAPSAPAVPTALAAATLPPAAPSTVPSPGGAVEPGRYATDLLGLPLEFTVGEPTALRTARRGVVVLSPVGTAPSSLAGAPHLQLIRLGGWNTREEAVDHRFKGVGGIAPRQIDDWVATSDVVVSARSSTLVDGRGAVVVDLHVDPSSPLGDGVCPAEARPCFWFASVPEDSIADAAIRLDSPLYGDMLVRMWLVDIAGADPLLVEAAAVPDDPGWLDRVEATTVATMRIGAAPRSDRGGPEAIPGL